MKPSVAVVLLSGVMLLVPERCQAQEPKRRAVLEGHQANVGGLVFSKDDTLLALGALGTPLWEVRTGKVRANLQGHNPNGGGMAIGKDGTLVALGGHNNLILLWEIPPANKPGQ